MSVLSLVAVEDSLRAKVMAALSIAHDLPSLEPLADYIDLATLDEEQFIMHGHKFLTFGKKERVLIEADLLMAKIFAGHALETAVIRTPVEQLIDHARDLPHGGDLQELIRVIAWQGHGHPAWLTATSARIVSVFTGEEVGRMAGRFCDGAHLGAGGDIAKICSFLDQHRTHALITLMKE